MRIKSPLWAHSLPPKAGWLYWASLAVSGCLLVIAAQQVGMLNQGDYWRAMGKFLVYPAGHGGGFANPQGYSWDFQAEPGGPMAGGGISSTLFWLAALLQRPLGGSFNLLMLGATMQVAMLVLAERLAARIAALFEGGTALRWSLAVALLLSIFAAHNIAFLNSFYMEFALIPGLPLLLFGLLGQGRSGHACLLAGALLCGAAKVQYFYLPTLLATVLLFVAWRSRERLASGLVVGLALIQLVCLVPVLKSDYQQINYHHSTRLGSYLVLDASERAALGIGSDLDACIGVDAWGNRLTSAGSVHIDSSGHACGSGEGLKLSDVLAPYLNYPQVLARLWQASAQVHFTVRYFHVDVGGRYLAPTRSAGFGLGQALVTLSDLRDRILRPTVALVVLGVGLMLSIRQIGRRGWALAPAIALLALFCSSQLVVSLVGEGVRDLSRHWAGAQYSLDLMVVLLFMQVMAWFRIGWSDRHSAAG